MVRAVILIVTTVTPTIRAVIQTVTTVTPTIRAVIQTVTTVIPTIRAVIQTVTTVTPAIRAVTLTVTAVTRAGRSFSFSFSGHKTAVVNYKRLLPAKSVMDFKFAAVLQTANQKLMKAKTNLDLKSKTVPQLIEFANHVVAAMTGNVNFPNPHPTLASMTAAIAALQTADTNAQGAGPTQTSILHQKEETVRTMLTQLALYVEGIVNDPSVADAMREGMILSAGMQVRAVAHPQKHHFAVKHGAVSGSVDLTAQGITHGFHNWEYILEPAASNQWVSAPSTTQAHTVVTGLQPGSTYSFRHRAVTKDGESDWEQVLTIIVN